MVYLPYTPLGYVAQGGLTLIHDNKSKLLNRLNRIAGQVRGVANMVEADRYCIDILTQIQAIRAALTKVETELLRDHMGHCVHEAFASGDAAEQSKKTEELIELLHRAHR
jgi:DNA-binding FrmR family transcriptional regulator